MEMKLEQIAKQNLVFELEVNNHAGVMAHIVSLFARRGFNLEGILVLPMEGKPTSQIWLLVNEDNRLQQMMAQLQKLEDVLQINIGSGQPNVFFKLQVAINEERLASKLHG